MLPRLAPPMPCGAKAGSTPNAHACLAHVWGARAQAMHEGPHMMAWARGLILFRSIRCLEEALRSTCWACLVCQAEQAQASHPVRHNGASTPRHVGMSRFSAHPAGTSECGVVWCVQWLYAKAGAPATLIEPSINTPTCGGGAASSGYTRGCTVGAA